MSKQQYNDLKEKLRGITISGEQIRRVIEHDKQAKKEAEESLNRLATLAYTTGATVTEEYKEGFIQGYIEASWKGQNL